MDPFVPLVGLWVFNVIVASCHAPQTFIHTHTYAYEPTHTLFLEAYSKDLDLNQQISRSIKSPQVARYKHHMFNLKINLEKYEHTY